MMVRAFCLGIMLVSLTACATRQQVQLPQLTAAPTLQKSLCIRPFPAANRQFVHSIDFTMGNGTGTTLIGVTTLTRNSIESSLITLEGLTLFDALYKENRIKIRRAVPPFDKPGFAQGLLNDVRAIFLPPPGDVQIGRTGETPVCRFTSAEGTVTDILFTDNCWQLNSYTADLLPERSITGTSCSEKENILLAKHLELTTFGQTGYTLNMSLISADDTQDTRQ